MTNTSIAELILSSPVFEQCTSLRELYCFVERYFFSGSDRDSIETPRITTRLHFSRIPEDSYKQDRYYAVFSFWLDGKPVAIGKRCWCHKQLHVVDLDLFTEMIGYIHTLILRHDAKVIVDEPECIADFAEYEIQIIDGAIALEKY